MLAQREQKTKNPSNRSLRPVPTAAVGVDVGPSSPTRYNFNNSRNRFVCARETGISDCRLSFIFNM
jgi:hypothetical protein